ncbi:MAG: hypothetical protein Q9172_001244 [Xanthocarpia lactea]
MSIAGSETQTPAVTCKDLEAYSEQQVVDWLKRQECEEGFDISTLGGVRLLSETERDDLAQRLNKAAMLLPLRTDDLHARLQKVASRQDGSPDLEPSQSRSESIASTPLPPTFHDVEVACRKGLIEAGGRPVCSIQELSHILAAPTVGYETVLSWLSDDPDSETGTGDLKTVFTRQFWRWWEFRKSQWDSRGLGDSEAGFSAFLEATKRKHLAIGNKAWVSGPSFDETNRRRWQHMPTSRQLPEGQTFSAHSNAVKIRLAPHQFTKPIQLRKDPQKQTIWTDWLEYLSFELRCLEKLTAAADSLEPECHQSMRRLLRAKQPNGNRAASRSAAFVSTKPQQYCQGGKGVNMAKELAAARADRDASQKSIDDFIRETRAYMQARRDVFYQKHRVEWVIKEARLMENEMSSLSNWAKVKKRKQRDEEAPEPQPKSSKRRVGGRNANSVTTPATPHPRRNPRRSARQTSLKG